MTVVVKATCISDFCIFSWVMSAPTNDAGFFPSIGSVANQTDLLPEEEENIRKDAEGQDNDDRPMQEVDSLCMSCGEQVRMNDS